MLPKTYRLAVRHNFGEAATVTVRGSRWKYDASTGILTYTDVTWLNAVSVPDATDSNSADQDNDTDKDAGFHGLLIVSGTTLTGTINLYLVTKDGADYSDTRDSEPLASLSFSNVDGPLEANFEK